MAREFAVGGEALAPHANDAAARDYFGQYPRLDVRKPLVRNVGVIFCWLAVLYCWGHFGRRLGKNEISAEDMAANLRHDPVLLGIFSP
ncbi:MAG: hypothetical protein ABSH22_03730 [Tepidisphaeraceae bacterium]